MDRKPFVSEDAKDGLFRIHLFLGLFFLGGDICLSPEVIEYLDGYCVFGTFT